MIKSCTKVICTKSEFRTTLDSDLVAISAQLFSQAECATCGLAQIYSNNILHSFVHFALLQCSCLKSLTLLMKCNVFMFLCCVESVGHSAQRRRDLYLNFIIATSKRDVCMQCSTQNIYSVHTSLHTCWQAEQADMQARHQAVRQVLCGYLNILHPDDVVAPVFMRAARVHFVQQTNRVFSRA